jgi:hypothetical protein
MEFIERPGTYSVGSETATYPHKLAFVLHPVCKKLTDRDALRRAALRRAGNKRVSHQGDKADNELHWAMHAFSLPSDHRLSH